MSGIDDALREELTALLDDALPQERAAELRARMETDARLRREFDELRQTVGMVRALPQERAPDELRERLRAGTARPTRAPAPIFRWVGSIAAAAAVAAVAFFLVQTQEQPPEVLTEARRAAEPEPSLQQPAPADAPRDALGRRDRAQTSADKVDTAKRGFAKADTRGEAKVRLKVESRVEAEGEADYEDGADGATDDAGDNEGLVGRLGAGKGAPRPATPAADEERVAEEMGELKETLRDAEARNEDSVADAKKLLQSVERGAFIQGAMRESYFLRLDASAPTIVVRHIDALAPTYTRGTTVEPLPAVYVANVVEARQVSNILARAYPVASAKAAEFASRKKTRGASASIAGAVAGSTRNELRIEVEANLHELAQLRSWLSAISLPQKNAKGGRSAPTLRKGPAAKSRKKQAPAEKPEPRKRYRIRILLPPKPAAPAGPNPEAAEK